MIRFKSQPFLNYPSKPWQFMYVPRYDLTTHMLPSGGDTTRPQSSLHGATYTTRPRCMDTTLQLYIYIFLITHLCLNAMVKAPATLVDQPFHSGLRFRLWTESCGRRRACSRPPTRSSWRPTTPGSSPERSGTTSPSELGPSSADSTLTGQGSMKK
jgi:hypothetical protein